MKLGKLKSRINKIDIRSTKCPVNERIRGREHGKIRYRILLRDMFTCQVCKNTYIPKFLEIDHITPLHLGGTETDENRQCICIDCHKAKSEREEKEWS